MNDQLDARALVAPWWDPETSEPQLEPGRLAYAVVPSPDFRSLGLVVEGRDDPREHGKAVFRTDSLRNVLAARGQPRLPVAAMPIGPWLVQRGKERPVLVLGQAGLPIPKSVAGGGQASWREPCVLVAPYYTADTTPGRAGFPTQVVSNIKRACYAQFLADQLPVRNASGVSVLRFDHVHALGAADGNLRLTEHVLTRDALELVLEWFRWAIEGVPPIGGLLSLVREECGHPTSSG